MVVMVEEYNGMYSSTLFGGQFASIKESGDQYLQNILNHFYLRKNTEIVPSKYMQQRKHVFICGKISKPLIQSP